MKSSHIWKPNLPTPFLPPPAAAPARPSVSPCQSGTSSAESQGACTASALGDEVRAHLTTGNQALGTAPGWQPAPAAAPTPSGNLFAYAKQGGFCICIHSAIRVMTPQAHVTRERFPSSGYHEARICCLKLQVTL